jgi:hypothetical protein
LRAAASPPSSYSQSLTFDSKTTNTKGSRCRCSHGRSLMLTWTSGRSPTSGRFISDRRLASQGSPALLLRAALDAPRGGRPCSHRSPPLLPRVGGLATLGRLRCCLRPEALLLQAVDVAAIGGCHCYPRSPALLP